jgi:hypothetical protein
MQGRLGYTWILTFQIFLNDRNGDCQCFHSCLKGMCVCSRQTFFMEAELSAQPTGILIVDIGTKVNFFIKGRMVICHISCVRSSL